MEKKETAIETNPFSVLGDALESAAETFEEATSNAKSSGKKAAATTKRVLARGVHGTAYGISYGIVYAAAFVTELLPEENLVRRGLVEGADDALAARVKIAEEKAKKVDLTSVEESLETTEELDGMESKPKKNGRKRKKSDSDVAETVNDLADNFEADAAD